MDDLFTLMDRSVAAKDQVVIASLNLHGIYKLFKDDVFRTLHEDPKTCVHIDGTPIIWLGFDRDGSTLFAVGFDQQIWRATVRGERRRAVRR